MTYVRTVRSYQALTVTEGDSKTRIGFEPVKMSAEAAKRAVEQARSLGIELAVSDTKPEGLAVRSGVGSQVGPDLSRGIGAISGHGAPVETFAAPAEAQPDPEVLEAGGDPYEGMLKADLEAAVEARNASRDDADKITVGGTGTVADLRTALVADDSKEL